MKRSVVIILAGLCISALLGAGCASTGAQGKGGEQEKALSASDEKGEKIDNLKISEFILGNGDSVDISVYRQDDLKRTAKIDLSGRIMFPLIGDVQVSGKSIYKIRDEMQERLSKYVVNPQVIISITAVQSQKVVLLGEVKTPGVYTLDYDLNISEAIARAGGLSDNAKSSAVVLLRREGSKQTTTAVDVKRILDSGDLSGDILLRNGDIVYVPKRTLANVSWLMSHISQILSPFISTETGIVLWPQVKDVLQGKSPTTVFTVPTQ
ncbi:MAG: polysaccharide export protein [Alphaproteobacteria bacterium]|uniref:Polysaccharide export protein n=1 Tax=Candidatus Nitrobium versatile TaxID=2884831 RepID=A0A953JFB1_9BACT|nr:polysaccharide export protein [Candidatus Nitrobium versatile]